MRVAAILAALGLFAIPASAGVQTRTDGGRVHIEAQAAPLSDVLADLAEHTGMKVAYEGAPPRELVTATLERNTLLEALLAVFEGLDLTYVIELDAAGTGVAKLLMVGNGPRGVATSKGPFPGRMGGSARPAEPPSEADPDPGETETPDDAPEVNDPSTVMRDRVVSDPRTGEALYGVPPDVAPDAPEAPSDVPVQGYPPADTPGGIPPGPMAPFLRLPQGMPNPQPQPTPAAP